MRGESGGLGNRNPSGGLGVYVNEPGDWRWETWHRVLLTLEDGEESFVLFREVDELVCFFRGWYEWLFHHDYSSSAIVSGVSFVGCRRTMLSVLQGESCKLEMGDWGSSDDD